MVYDEGFDINFKTKDSNKNDRSYFVFSRYGYNIDRTGSIKSKWASYCYSSLIGWYHIGDYWGCFYGVKENADKDEVTNGEATNKLNVVEGIITKRNDSPESNNILNTNSITPNDDIGEIRSLTNEITFLESETKVETLDKDKIQLNSEFKDHAKVVEHINSSDFLWKAENYEQFASMTLSELNRFAGKNKSRNQLSYRSKRFSKFKKFKNLKTKKFVSSLSRHSFLMKNNFSLGNNLNSINELPKSFHWGHVMSPAKSQGSCGSCFAVSTLTMLEARIRKNYPEVVKKYFPNPIDLTLSLSHILKCSYYNQGCDGGYAYLVLKFLNEFELLHEKCFSHDSCEKKCSDKNLEKLHFSVSDYKYNGGSYGKCSEEVILNEVYHNGPIVVSLEPDYSFMFYKSGIYQSPHSNWMSNKLSKPEWQKVDHSVVLVGWGEEMVKGEFVKYWILQNSWGGYWGESGYLKFIRGIDHLGIESTCESGVPIVIEN